MMALLRPLKLLSYNKNIQILIESIKKSMYEILNVIIVCLIVW